MGEKGKPGPARLIQLLRRHAPFLVLVISAAVTLLTVLVLLRVSRARDQALFQNQVRQVTTRLLDRLDVYKAALRGGASLFSADRAVTPEQFASFVRRQNVKDLYPGILGIGWADAGGAADSSFLFPRELAALPALGPGLAGARRQAMEISRDRGGAQMTERIPLTADGGTPPRVGFLLYLPIYSGDSFPPPLEVRRDQLIGFVFAPIAATEFFAGALGSSTSVAVRVFDGGGLDPRQLYYGSAADPQRAPRFSAVVRVFVTGHSWTLLLESSPEFEAQLQSAFPFYALAVGSLATLLLFGLARTLSRAAHAAEAANRAKSAFLATMSHELRTPLNAIMGYADLLDLGVPEPVGPKAREQVSRIHAGARHLLELIDAVLQLARVEARMEAPRLEPVDVDEVIHSAVVLTTPLAERKGLRLRHRRQEGGAVVQTDAGKLRQICINLIGNAIKFTPAGEIRIESTQARDELLIRVVDSGIGIAPEHLDRVFDAFWQADRGLTRSAGGAGLGLAVSRNLARLLGGDITCQSAPGQGSTFTVRLPFQRHAGAGSGAET